MITDITYCDWLCPNERCERNAYRLEEAVKQNSGLLEQVSFAAFTDCPNYGNTAGCYVPNIAEIMKGIRIGHEYNPQTMTMDYRIMFINRNEV